MSKGMRIYAARLFVERALGLLLFLFGASWQIGLRAGLWFVVYFAAAAAGAWFYRANAQLMERRANIAETKDVTPVWDKVILALFWLLAYFVIYYVAGVSLPQTNALGGVFFFALALYAASTVLTLCALRENAYAESVSRVQSERNQKVCNTGPYAYVRHPMYSAILIWCLAIVLVFPSISVAIVSLAVAVLIIVRTLLEDAMLAKGLEGYEAYRRLVRWRLIPGVF